MCTAVEKAVSSVNAADLKAEEAETSESVKKSDTDVDAKKSTGSKKKVDSSDEDEIQEVDPPQMPSSRLGKAAVAVS